MPIYNPTTGGGGGTGQSYPSKAGDSYATFSGPINPSDDIKLDGTIYSSSTYPAIVNYKGFAPTTDPDTVESTFRERGFSQVDFCACSGNGELLFYNDASGETTFLYDLILDSVYGDIDFNSGKITHSFSSPDSQGYFFFNKGGSVNVFYNYDRAGGFYSFQFVANSGADKFGVSGNNDVLVVSNASLREISYYDTFGFAFNENTSTGVNTTGTLTATANSDFVWYATVSGADVSNLLLSFDGQTWDNAYTSGLSVTGTPSETIDILTTACVNSDKFYVLHSNGEIWKVESFTYIKVGDAPVAVDANTTFFGISSSQDSFGIGSKVNATQYVSFDGCSSWTEVPDTTNTPSYGIGISLPQSEVYIPFEGPSTSVRAYDVTYSTPPDLQSPDYSGEVQGLDFYIKGK